MPIQPELIALQHSTGRSRLVEIEVREITGDISPIEKQLPQPSVIGGARTLPSRRQAREDVLRSLPRASLKCQP
jgi:hypothetical protein